LQDSFILATLFQ